MAIFPGANTSRMLGAFTRRMADHRGVVLHVAVSESAYPAYGPGLGAHFYVRKDGTIVQQIDTAIRGGHAFRGNASMIGIETQGGVNNPQGEPWTGAQVVALGRLVRWLHDVHGIPLALMPNSRPTSRGVGWHRQGCWGNYDAGHPGIVSGGEKWTTHAGKVCPGNKKIDQIPQVLALARGKTSPAKPTPEPAPAPTPHHDEEDEDMRDRLDAIYLRYLGRPIGDGTFATWGTEIATGRKTYTQFEAFVKGSPEAHTASTKAAVAKLAA